MLEKQSAKSKDSGKREKFVELAESRTKNAIKAIRIISKLGNKNAYEYSEADVKKIAAALSREIEALKARMLSSSGKDTVDFKL
jgi:ribosomal protein L7/L12